MGSMAAGSSGASGEPALSDATAVPGPPGPPAAPDASAAPDTPGVDRWLHVGALSVGLALRWWDLGADTLTADELFTGAVSGLPVDRIVAYVADHDAHPPVDYLLRSVVAGSRDAALLRAPSALLSSAFLLTLWWWLRGRGRLGTLVVAIAAVHPFLLFYGRQARPYALVALLGLVAALAVERCRSGRRAWVAVLAASLCLALLTHYSAVFVVLGVVVVAGIGREATAWWLRAAALSSLALAAAVWGRVFLEQRQRGHTAWVPRTTLDTAAVEVGRLVGPWNPELGIWAVVVAAAGLHLLRRDGDPMGPLVGGLVVLPVVGVLVVGLREPILAARSFSAMAWGVPAGIGAALVAARGRGRVVALAVVAVVVAAMAPSVPPVYTWREDAPVVASTMARVMRPGDGAVSEVRDAAVFVWAVGTPLDLPPDPRVGADGARYAQVVPGAAFTGRVWTFHRRGGDLAPPGLAPCAPDAGSTVALGDDLELRCWERPG